ATAMASSTIATAAVPLPFMSPSAFYYRLLRSLPPPLPFLHRQRQYSCNLVLDSIGSLQPQPLPMSTLSLPSPYHACSPSTPATTSIINTASSFAIAAPISTLLLLVTIASTIPYTDMLPSSLR
ncbi:hypothetical protein BHE74_00048892, partial [Ensete ventricosum]